MSGDVYYNFCTSCGKATDHRGPRCGYCGESVLIGNVPLGGNPLPEVREQILRTHWMFDNSQSSKFNVLQEQKGVFTVQKRGVSNSWKTIWSNVPIKSGIHYIEYEICSGTTFSFGFIEQVLQSHRDQWTQNPMHYQLHTQWSGTDTAPWNVSTNGTHIFCCRDDRDMPGQTTFQTGQKIGFVVDFFSDKIDYYRTGTFVTTLVTGIRKFTDGIYPAMSAHNSLDMVRVFTDLEKPQTVKEIEARMLVQQDFIRQLHAQVLRLRQQINDRGRQNEVDGAELNNLRSQLQIQQQLIDQFRTGNVLQPAEHVYVPPQ